MIATVNGVLVQGTPTEIHEYQQLSQKKKEGLLPISYVPAMHTPKAVEVVPEYSEPTEPKPHRKYHRTKQSRPNLGYKDQRGPVLHERDNGIVVTVSKLNNSMVVEKKTFDKLKDACEHYNIPYSLASLYKKEGKVVKNPAGEEFIISNGVE